MSLAWITSAQAQNTYPNRPIQMIMPLQAGSGVDILMRPIVQKMGENLGQAITIENLPGGSWFNWRKQGGSSQFRRVCIGRL